MRSEKAHLKHKVRSYYMAAQKEYFKGMLRNYSLALLRSNLKKGG